MNRNKKFARTTGILATLLISILMVSLLAGCGSSGTATSDEAATQAMDMNGVAPAAEAPAMAGGVTYTSSDKGKSDSGFADAAGYAGPDRASEEGAVTVTSIGGGVDVSQDVSNAILAERKVIRSANVSLEVENFDEAYGQISNFILGIGYIQSTSIDTDKVYISKEETKLVRNGMMVIRIDKDRFDKVLNSLKGIGTVLSWNLNSEDVTKNFIDTESRLRLLKIEESKIEEYMKKLTDLDQIYKTESKLTELRYQIEALTGNLRQMSDLVDLSTITINISEKYPDALNKPEEPKTYGQRLLQNLSDSFKGVINFVGELIIILVAALPVLILLGLVAIAAIVLYRRTSKRYRNKDDNEIKK